MADPTFEDTYEIGELLGSGAFAEVFTCTAKPHGSKYAVKIIKNAEPNVKVEIEILKTIDHLNIVRLVDVFQRDRTIYMVQELINGGEMFDYIIEKGIYSEADACKSFGMILEGLKYLHDRQIIHRDLKPENILLSEKSENAVIKIADFGLAKNISQESMTSTTCGTPGYVAPEVLRQKQYGVAIDIWAAGVILYIMVSGYEPFYDANETQMFKNIMLGKYTFPADLFNGVSPEIINFIRRILVVNPDLRPTATECLFDPWLKDHNDAQKSKALNMAKANLTKMQAKKKFKGALIAVRLGGRMQNFLSGAHSPPSLKQTIDLDFIAKEMNANDQKVNEGNTDIVKDAEPVDEQETAVTDKLLGAEALPGQVPE